MADDNDTPIDVQTPPSTPTSPTPSLASAAEPEEKDTGKKHVFKSNLQVLLKRQDNELVKNIEYKKKVEDGDENESPEAVDGSEGCKKENEYEGDVKNLSEKGSSESGSMKDRVKAEGKTSPEKTKDEQKAKTKEKEKSSKGETDKKKEGTKESSEENVKKEVKDESKAKTEGKKEEKSQMKKKDDKETKNAKNKADEKEKIKKPSEESGKKEGKEKAKEKSKDIKEEKSPKIKKDIKEEKSPKIKKDDKKLKAGSKEKQKSKSPKDLRKGAEKESVESKQNDKMEEGKHKDTSNEIQENNCQVTSSPDITMNNNEASCKENENQSSSSKENENQCSVGKENENQSSVGKENENQSSEKKTKIPEAQIDKEEQQKTKPSEAQEKENTVHTTSDSTLTVSGTSGAKAVKKEKHQGIMMKKGTSPFSVWKKYYFVLDGKLLMYYKSEADYNGFSGGAKGSLDLTMLEDIKLKKSGKTKSRFPFALARRNLKSINLAAETEGERERWMGAIRNSLGHPNRFSGSENILNKPDSPVADPKQEKYATMPTRTVTSQSEDSPSSDSEEEPVLIKPRKVERKGPGINLDLSSIKLKKTEQLPKSLENKNASKDEANKDGGEVFGVKLRKPVAKGMQGDGVSKENVSSPEGGEATENVIKPSNKQPNIPLNKSPLLAHTDVDVNSLSPDNQRFATVDRKRSPSSERKKSPSPSPSIPLSKSFHAFVSKSNEEQEERKEDMPNEVTEVNEVPICIAESKEIRYSDGVKSMDTITSVEFVQVEERTSADEDKLEENREELSRGDSKEIIGIPQVSITVKENSEDEVEYEELDEDFLRMNEQNKTAELTNRESGKFSNDGKARNSKQSNSEKEDISLDSDSSKSSEDDTCAKGEVAVPNTFNDEKQVENSLETSPPSDVVNHPKPCEIDRNSAQVDEEFLKNVTSSRRPSNSSLKNTSTKVLTDPSGKNVTENGATPPRSPFRIRSGTNESSASSCKSDSDNPDKKLGKFKIFQSRKSSIVDDEKQDEKERKKKSSFSKFLPGKKHKEKKSKAEEKNKRNSQPEGHAKTPESPVTNKNPVVVPEITCMEVEDTSKTDEITNTNKIDEITNTSEKKNIDINIQDASPCQDVEVRHKHFTSKEITSRSSTYSCSSTTSREADPPPEVPEKRGLRSSSPAYDVPQSNQPVSSVNHNDSNDDLEIEENRKVDGMISQEQIDAILTAKDTRERKRRSSEQMSAGYLVPPHSSGPASFENSDDTNSRRRSKVSITSTESDEPLPKTHFLCVDRNSCSSGSLKNQSKSDDSDASSDTQVSCTKPNETSCEPEPTVVLRKPSRLTESLTSGARVSLTLPEFTVVEEDGPGTPETPKAAVKRTTEFEDDERDDYFPVIGGGDVELRTTSLLGKDLNPPGTALRTSGIIGLKAFLEENQEELENINSGISRLGHSAAVEKLKRESSEDC